MRVSPIQSDFSAGELSDKILGHVQSDLHRAGVKRAANFIMTQQGTAASRAGSRLVTSQPDGNFQNPVWLLPMQNVLLRSLPYYPDGTPHGAACDTHLRDLVVEVSYTKIRILDRNGPLRFRDNNEAGNSLIYPPRFRFSFEKDRWTFITLGENNVAPFYDDDDDSLHFTEVADLQGFLTAALTYFQLSPLTDEEHAGGQPPLKVTTEFWVAGAPVTLTIYDVEDAENPYHTATYAPGYHKVTGIQMGWAFIGMNISAIRSAKVWGLKMYFEGPGTDTFYVDSFTAPWVDVDWSNVQIPYAQGTMVLLHADTGHGYADVPLSFLVFVTPDNGQWCLMYNHYSGAWDFSEITLSDKTITALGVYQERLWVGHADGTIAASVVGFTNNVTYMPGSSSFGQGFIFAHSSPPKAAEGLDLRLGQTAGPAHWFHALRGFLMGCAKLEYIFEMDASLALDPAQGTVFSILEHSAYGSERIQPVSVLDKFVFVPEGARRLLQAGIALETQGGLVADDITLAAEHLFRAGVRSIAFIKSPTPRLVAVTNDAQMLVGTITRGKLPAWSRVILPDPYHPVCLMTARANGGTDLFIGCRNGSTLVFTNFDSTPVQKYATTVMRLEEVEDLLVPFDQEYFPPLLDAWLQRPLDPAGAPLGWNVRALPVEWVGAHVMAQVHGKILGPYTVIAWTLVDGVPTEGGFLIPKAALPDASQPGDIADTAFEPTPTSDHAPLVAHVGLVYPEHRLITLPRDEGNPAGTAQAHMQRGVQFYLRFVDSYMPKVDGNQMPARDANDPVSELPARFTGDRRFTQLGFKRAATYEITQDQPLRVEISAIFGGVEVSTV